MSTSARDLAELALQLGRLAYGEAAAGLTPAQWAALRFFARANRFSRTVSGFAEFHATTRGTASQTVKGLVVRGLLRRTPSARDGRSVCFDLTPAARRALRRDPFEAVVRAAEMLSNAEQSEGAQCLRAVMRGVADERARPVAGRCGLCGHLQTEDTGDAPFTCRLMREPLAAVETDELCCRFSPRTAEG